MISSPKCRVITARKSCHPALFSAAAFWAMMLEETRMVMEAASRGANGLSRRMTPGKDMLSQAPAATGASTTCEYMYDIHLGGSRQGCVS